MEDDNLVHCPVCGSTQIVADRQGFSLGKAIVGDVLFGTVGLLGGFIGHKKIKIRCLKCGYTWKVKH